MEVIAIESGDAAGWLEAATTLGEVEFDSIQSFVENVSGFVRGASINKLHWQAHGDSTGVEAGSDMLTLDNFKDVYRAQLSRLVPCFAPGALVVLRACEVGQNVALMANLAGAWNVTVVAGRGFQNNLYNFNLGRYVSVKPYGTTTTSFFLPKEASYDRYGGDERLMQKYLK